MKRPYTSFALLLFCAPAFAQFTAADIAPQAGTQFVQHYAQHIPPNGGGVGTTEDYSSLVTDSTVTVNYVAASSTPNGASFSDCEVAWMDGNGNYTYYNITDTEMEDKGWDLNGNVVVASDPEKWAVFPLGYGTTWTDTHALTFTSGGLTTSRSGTLFAQGDATSTTLLMPYGTVTDVKRVFMYDTYTDDVAGLFTINYTFTYYFYYKLGWHHPVLIVQDLLITPSVGPVSHQLFSVYVDAPTGITEQGTSLAAFAVSPSLASDEVTIRAELGSATDLSIDLLDATGAIVRQERIGVRPAGAFQYRMDVGTLPEGIYLVRSSNGTMQSTARVVVQR